ncbi:MAG: AMP-binding protein [Cellvibrionaceae bacterium]
MSEQDLQPLEMLYQWEATKPDAVYLRQSKQGEFVDYTWGEVAQRARKLANYLKGLGFPAGSRVAIYSQNSPDWFVTDFAIMMSGYVSVPLYPGQSAQSMRYVLEHSDSKLLFIGHADHPESIEQALDGTDIQRVGLLGCQSVCGTDIEAIVESTEALQGQPLRDMDTLYTLMYTSGTTGNPKGVMHHFENVSWAVGRMAADIKLHEKTRFFSYLPLSHTAERVLVLLYSLYTGATVAFPESMETFNSDLQKVRPTFFFSVPRLWKKFKEAVESKVPADTIDAMLADPEKAEGFKQQIQAQLGLDAAEFIITGSAPTPLDVQEWYLKLGMPLRNGYGMTENCIHGSICLEGDPVPGTAGKPFSGCEVKIGGGQEILFKTPAMMKGYYRNPEKTAEVLIDGYYHTGDTGFIDEQGLLHVTGRLSEAFKTTKGKFVKPSNIEDVMADLTCLGQMCAIGHGMEAPVLLAGLSELGAAKTREQVEAEIVAELPAINARLAVHERITQVFLVADEWTIDNELLTPTMKLKRNSLVDRYQAKAEASVADGTVVWES